MEARRDAMFAEIGEALAEAPDMQAVTRELLLYYSLCGGDEAAEKEAVTCLISMYCKRLALETYLRLEKYHLAREDITEEATVKFYHTFADQMLRASGVLE